MFRLVSRAIGLYVCCWFGLAVLISINVVTLRQARLVSGLVNILAVVNHLGAVPGILSPSHPSVGRRNECPAKTGRIGKQAIA